MNVYDEKGQLVQVEEVENQKPSFFKKAIGTATAVTTLAVVTTPAHAAILDLSELTTEMTSIKTAIIGVIAVAVAIGIAVIGWRWAKRALFSI